jgi:hypothetical protein
VCPQMESHHSQCLAAETWWPAYLSDMKKTTIESTHKGERAPLNI